MRVPSNAERVFEGRLFSIFQWTQRLYDGFQATFEMARRPDNVIVLGLADGHILATVQHQPGLDEPFLDFPGGRVEPTETPAGAALTWLTLPEAQLAALTNHRLAIVPVLLARDTADLTTGCWL